MNVQNIGKRIENTIKAIENLHDDAGGFDASWEGIPIEIKGCMKSHKNGVGYKGKIKTTKGRFWIDNRAHRLLLERRGFYIFVVYRMQGIMPTITCYQYMSAWKVDKWINNGDNTKIRYDIVFPDYKGDKIL